MTIFASEMIEYLYLFARFDSLCDNFQPEIVRQEDNDSDDFAEFAVAVHASNESSVDLQTVDGELVQPT